MDVDGVLLSVENLCVSFFTQAGVAPAVQNVSFSIKKGQTFALVGESGCGKTTAALAIMRLLPAGQGSPCVRRGKPAPATAGVQGKIVFEGQNLLALSEKQMRLTRGNKISMVFQEPATSLNPVYTVGDQIAEAIQLHRNKGADQAWEDAVALLRKVGIADPERRVLEYPHRLSGGMQQRVMIAMALSCNPALLIADEPTTALDTTVQAQILDLLDGLQKQNGMSILLITHNLGVAAQRADIIAVMYASRLVEIADAVVQSRTLASDDSRQLFAPSTNCSLADRPPFSGLSGTGTGSIGAGHHPYTQGLLQSLPRVGSAVKRLQTIPGTVPDPLHLPGGCRFHPRCRAGCADTRCQTIEPVLRETQPGRWTACWRAPGYQ